MLEARFDVVAVVEDGKALMRAAMKHKPDVALLDISMPELNGIDAARQIRQVLPKTKVIFVTMYVDPTFVREAFRAGASGYVAKRSAPTELENAIDTVLEGKPYITPLVTRDFVESVLTGREQAPAAGRLTPRQREVLQLVAAGLSAKEIAAKLHITPKTVEFHKSGIMRTLGVRTTSDLVKYAIRHGLASV
jgi:DNA-binding NarL/FixJ family response regulator